MKKTWEFFVKWLGIVLGSVILVAIFVLLPSSEEFILEKKYEGYGLKIKENPFFAEVEYHGREVWMFDRDTPEALRGVEKIFNIRQWLAVSMRNTEEKKIHVTIHFKPIAFFWRYFRKEPLSGEFQ